MCVSVCVCVSVRFNKLLRQLISSLLLLQNGSSKHERRAGIEIDQLIFN